jgi:hypothetical protein
MEEVAFSVGLSAHHTQTQGHIVLFDKVFINKGLAYNTQTGKFTAKLDKLHHPAIAPETLNCFR